MMTRFAGPRGFMSAIPLVLLMSLPVALFQCDGSTSVCCVFDGVWSGPYPDCITADCRSNGGECKKCSEREAALITNEINFRGGIGIEITELARWSNGQVVYGITINAPVLDSGEPAMFRILAQASEQLSLNDSPIGGTANLGGLVTLSAESDGNTWLGQVLPDFTMWRAIRQYLHTGAAQSKVTVGEYLTHQYLEVDTVRIEFNRQNADDNWHLSISTDIGFAASFEVTGSVSIGDNSLEFGSLVLQGEPILGGRADVEQTGRYLGDFLKLLDRYVRNHDLWLKQSHPKKRD